ncbi:MAG: FtsX-like permease family protein [candidate division Zixibacteria bacterium]|nr:FtsX-like permease family protein [candidate division Zixibacteria bacterium]
MFTNYLKVTYRNLIRNKLYSIISVVGLSVGIACCILIFLYVQDEVTFDRFHSDADNIYRVIHMESLEGEFPEGTESTSALLYGELKKSFPDIKGVTRASASTFVVTYNDKSFTEDVVHVDPDFFNMFSFPLITGNASSVLNDPNSVVLTPEMAHKYFGDENPIGKALSINMGETALDFSVSGIIEKAPSNSSIQYNMLISTEMLKHSVPERLLHTWHIILFSTFIQLEVGTDIASFETQLTDLVAAIDPELDVSYKLQPLTNIHLNPKYAGESVNSNNPRNAIMLSAIALAVLIIACINFMTLAVGRSSSRFREVGLRKVLGAHRRQVMMQFWGEALFLCIFSLIIGIALAEAFLPYFNNLADKELIIGLLSNPFLLPALICLTVITAFLAGIYPSLLLSKLIPAEILRGAHKFGSKNRLIQGMIILQFAISVFLIICMFIISSQIDFISGAKLGYNKSAVITFPTETTGEEASQLLTRLRNELADENNIIDISGYSYSIGASWLYLNISEEHGNIVLIGEDITGPGYAYNSSQPDNYFYINWIDEHYIPTMGIEVIEGRNFSEEHTSDVNNAVIINQTAAEIWGLENPIGQKLPQGFKKATIIGVVDDFHFYPLHRKIEPLVFHMPNHDHLSSIFNIAVRISGHDIPGTISFIENKWNKASGGKPLTFEFLDESVAQQYSAEQQWKSIVQYSSLLSFFIACLGLFGLTSLAVAKRTREVGIRKVLGASITRIVMMFSGDFVKLVLIANLISWPVAYYLMKIWLEKFEYHVNINFGLFLISAVITICLAILTIAFEAIRAALANPTQSLRHE